MNLFRAFFLGYIFLSSFPAFAAVTAKPVEKIFLLIHSYEKDYSLTNDQDAGAIDAFTKHKMSEKGWKLEKIYLDQKKKTGAELAGVVAQTKAKVVQLKPSAMLLTDDFAMRNFFPIALSLHIPTVFSGVNADAETYGYKPGMKMVSGTLERYNYPTTLQLLHKLRPNLKKLLLVNDEDITGKAIEEDFFKKVNNDLTAKDAGFAYESYRGTDFDNLKRKLLSVNISDTGVFLMTIYAQRNANNAHISHKDIDKWIREKTNFIDIGLAFFQVQDGRLMSLAGSMRESGYYAGDLLFCSIGEGFDLSTVPVRTMLPLRLVLNHERAKTLAIKFPFDILTYAEDTDRLGQQ